MSKKLTQKCTEGNTKPLCNKRDRNWCFTSFHEKPPTWNPDNCRYLCYAPEKCPTTGRDHWQCFVSFHDAKTFSSVQKMLKGAHIDQCLGNAEQNRTYCKGPYEKDGKVKPENPAFVEFGKLPEQGKRTDIIEMKDKLLKEEITLEEIICENPEFYHQYGRTFDKLDDIKNRKKFRTKMTTCDYLWGPTGSGKSHEGYKDFNPDTHYNYKDDNGWWEGYKGQRVVIINDFRGSIPYNELLKLIDKWPYEVKRRGPEPMPFTSEHIIITSSLPPNLIYKNRDEEDKLDQLLRRIKVIHMAGKCSPPASGSPSPVEEDPLDAGLLP